MPGGVRTFDPAKVAVSFGGFPISGFAEGTFIRVERVADMFSMKTGSDGDTARVKSNNRAGTVTLTLMQTSLSNDALSGIAIADELSNTGVVPIAIKDLSGATTFFSATGWIRKIPDWEPGGDDVVGIEWVIDAADIDIFIGGNNAEDAALN
jgi:hypothetical protein